MELLYLSELPVKCKTYKRITEIPLSDELKVQMNDYYREIMKSDSLSDTELKLKFRDIKQSVESEVRESGNAKSIFVSDYIDFLFGVSFLLFDKYKYSQAKVSETVGVKTNIFGKIDCYPKRCYDAYTKLDDEKNRKSLIPYKKDSEGIRIAEYINKNIQAVHACYGFIGVSNDLDLYANIATTDRKAFVLTSPFNLEADDVTSIHRANYAFAKYSFALGNRQFSDDGSYKAAGNIKEKILQLIRMEDFSVLPEEEQDEVLRGVLLSDKDLKPYMSVDSDYSKFQGSRDEYIMYFENMENTMEKLTDGYVNTLAESYSMSLRSGKSVMMEKAEISAEDVLQEHYNSLKELFERTEEKLLGYLDIPYLLRDTNICFDSWLEIIRRSVKENGVVKAPSGNATDSAGISFIAPTYENKLRSMASFWITEVFADYHGDEKKKESIIEYLGSKSPLFKYLDALNAPLSWNKKEHEEKGKELKDRSKKHIFMVDEVGGLYDDIVKLEFSFSKKSIRPLLMYIDTEAHPVDDAVLHELLSEMRVILIVRDKSGVAKSLGMELLSEDLNLYQTTNVEVM